MKYWAGKLLQCASANALTHYKNKFSIFFAFTIDICESFLKKFSSKNAYKLLIEGLAAASAAGQLAYYSNVYDYCQGLFLIFSTNFESDFWARCMLGICCAMDTSCSIGKAAGRACPAPTVRRVKLVVWVRLAV